VVTKVDGYYINHTVGGPQVVKIDSPAGQVLTDRWIKGGSKVGNTGIIKNTEIGADYHIIKNNCGDPFCDMTGQKSKAPLINRAPRATRQLFASKGSDVRSKTIAPAKPISPELKAKIDGLKTGDDIILPKGTKKDGLLDYLGGKDVEHAVYRGTDGEIHVTRGVEGSVTPGSDLKRFIYHNHPTGAPYLSGNNYYGEGVRNADVGAFHRTTPNQRSTIIGTKDGTYRNRIPRREEYFNKKGYVTEPEARKQIIGGSGSRDTPQVAWPIANQRTAKLQDSVIGRARLKLEAGGYLPKPDVVKQAEARK